MPRTAPRPLLDRYAAALWRLHELAPEIYTLRMITANGAAAKRMDDGELEYFTLAAEGTVRRKERRADVAPPDPAR